MWNGFQVGRQIVIGAERLASFKFRDAVQSERRSPHRREPLEFHHRAEPVFGVPAAVLDWARLDTVLVAQPSRLRVPAASRCEAESLDWIRAA